MTAPLIVKLQAEKSGLPTIAARKGVRILPTNEVTTAPNAVPMTTATARSSTLPRVINCRKPLSIFPLLCVHGIIQDLAAVFRAFQRHGCSAAAGADYCQ